MPLHLLGKKSWNVYNPENIARVHRDEAQAKAREEEEERRMQEIDAERRIQLLRGEYPSNLPPSIPPAPTETAQPGSYGRPESEFGVFRHKKRRRIAGEDDTDRDIRFAREDAVQYDARRDELLSSGRKGKNREEHVPIVDGTGHINLFTEDMTRQQRAEKNAEAEAEKHKKQRVFEDQYTMRLSNASGFKESAGQTPWYSANSKDAQAPNAMRGTDVWGNEDPLRQEREKARTNANDPLAAMKSGVRGLKNSQRERKEWQKQRLREIEDLERAQRSEHRRRRRRRPHSPDSLNSLEGFSLDKDSRKHSDESHETLRRSHKHEYQEHQRRHRHHHRRHHS
ncbi:conserved hypothetical protein [Talaromyces stipitatus ATCC 10500]|uniref:CBF1-interacting co-repressor CIR N-terminal domain-containing protein n=1 Tax=Talaromyces stipitatus (strain ATCC 10500 / CBS 375.48 / QM 6759 / NRRL 1006) TaxID=441959 RepID=B8M638_TALSN|nr:uncharacterized protein TSTA_023730 [Talaromyces stipitatus ATCC 10500]EED19038.1 conserved hypothetical protein [Talaromyces stipitatus ATCC 10500]